MAEKRGQLGKNGRMLELKWQQRHGDALLLTTDGDAEHVMNQLNDRACHNATHDFPDNM